MTGPQHPSVAWFLMGSLIATLVSFIVVQRADYLRLEQSHREDTAQILEVLGRKAVLVSPVDMAAFDHAANQKGKTP